MSCAHERPSALPPSQRDVVGLKEEISEKAIIRRSGTSFNALDVLEAEEAWEEEQASRQQNGAVPTSPPTPCTATAATAATQSANGGGSAGGAGGGGSGSGGSGGDSGKLARRARSKQLSYEHEELVVKVLPTRLAVVRLQASMLRLSAHALVHRLLFTPSQGSRCFWSFTYTEDEISLIIDETSLHLFPAEAIVGPSTRWRPLRLCGKSFAFDETGVVSAMFAPYEEGMPLLNFSTFSTNVSLVDESDLERAIESFDIPVVDDGLEGAR